MRILNLFNFNRYKNHPEAIIISCFFNPQNSVYRKKGFDIFYESIKHLNHQIIECIIGDTKPNLPENKNIKRVYTKNLLWHKETLLNKIISKLPKKYKYIFWIDADVLFTNVNWLVDAVETLQTNKICQPFEYCVHLKQDELQPDFDIDQFKKFVFNTRKEGRHEQLWRSYCSNVEIGFSENINYDVHGHVGFAWGARREVLEACPLYDKALIGGADHIIAHACMSPIVHNCIKKTFTDNIEEVEEWTRRFYNVVQGKVGYVRNNVLYHIWHGDLEKRNYYNRIKDFTKKSKQIVERDENGMYITNHEDDAYMINYFKQREVCQHV